MHPELIPLVGVIGLAVLAVMLWHFVKFDAWGKPRGRGMTQEDASCGSAAKPVATGMFIRGAKRAAIA